MVVELQAEQAQTLTSPHPIPASAAQPDAREPQPWHWTIEQFERLADLSFFRDQRVELIEGEIIEMTAMSDPHWAAVALVDEVLKEAFGKGYVVAVQLPVNLAQSQPLPDLAVIQGRPRDFKAGKPTTAALIVEVSQSSLEYDRTRKAALYARAGIPEYWIVNLVDQQLEVLRRAAARPGRRPAFGYLDLSIHGAEESVFPLAAPQSSIAMADLLP